LKSVPCSWDECRWQAQMRPAHFGRQNVPIHTSSLKILFAHWQSASGCRQQRWRPILHLLQKQLPVTKLLYSPIVDIFSYSCHLRRAALR
jgi:hypothetical protein